MRASGRRSTVAERKIIEQSGIVLSNEWLVVKHRRDIKLLEIKNRFTGIKKEINY